MIPPQHDIIECAVSSAVRIPAAAFQDPQIKVLETTMAILLDRVNRLADLTCSGDGEVDFRLTIQAVEDHESTR